MTLTFSEQKRIAEQALELWQIVLPHSQAPERYQFLMWAGMFPETSITRGINRAAQKFLTMRDTGKQMSADDAVRYANSVMRSESQRAA